MKARPHHQIARLRKVRADELFTDEGNPTQVTIYLGEIPAGGAVHYAYEVAAENYAQAKRLIEQQVYLEHGLKPVWAK